jgi:hypothetical protein
MLDGFFISGSVPSCDCHETKLYGIAPEAIGCGIVVLPMAGQPADSRADARHRLRRMLGCCKEVAQFRALFVTGLRQGSRNVASRCWYRASTAQSALRSGAGAIGPVNSQIQSIRGDQCACRYA